MEGTEVDIFVKAPDRMLLFLLKPIAEVKKSPLINDYENIIGCSEESKQSEVYANKRVCSKYIWGFWRSVPPQENLTIFTLT